MKRYYYKTIDNKNFLSLKNSIDISKPINGLEYISITEQEFNELTKPKEPTVEQKSIIEKKSRIAELHRKLKELDYIGVKIATGRATREEYADKIALMSAYASELNLLEKE